jgi:hypothetical protein
MFNFLGPQEVSQYVPGMPVTDANRIGTINYDKGEFIKTYHGPEIRFSARYAFTTTFSIKAGLNTMRQYVHLLSNTTIIAPTDFKTKRSQH